MLYLCFFNYALHFKKLLKLKELKMLDGKVIMLLNSNS